MWGGALYKTLTSKVVDILQLQVYNNGYISVGSGTTGGFTPRPFPRSGRIIAPYWADVDTRSGSGRVFYRETTSTSLRLRAAAQVRRIYHTSFFPTHLIIATWSGVGYYRRHTDKVCSPQLLWCKAPLEFAMLTSSLLFFLPSTAQYLPVCDRL